MSHHTEAPVINPDGTLHHLLVQGSTPAATHEEYMTVLCRLQVQRPGYALTGLQLRPRGGQAEYEVTYVPVKPPIPAAPAITISGSVHGGAAALQALGKTLGTWLSNPPPGHILDTLSVHEQGDKATFAATYAALPTLPAVTVRVVKELPPWGKGGAA